MKKAFKIEVDCANCANKMEALASKVPGAKEVSISFMTQRITVDFEDGVNPVAVMKGIQKVCKRVDSDCIITF